MKLQVTDTSYHNKQLDWNIFKEKGVQGVVLKASDGFFMPNDWDATSWDWHTDPSFVAYWKYIDKLFDWRMAYHYLRVDDEHAIYAKRPTSLEQVDYFYETVSGQGLNWNDYICLDIEQLDAELSYLNGKRIIADRIQAVIEKTERVFKRKPIIYTGAWWWEKYHAYFDNAFMNQYKFWLSHYWDINDNNEIINYNLDFTGVENAVFYKDFRYAYCKVPRLNGRNTILPENVVMWQYAEYGKLQGLDRRFDCNVIIQDEILWEAERGIPPEPPVVEPPIVIEPPVPPVPPPVDPQPTEPPLSIPCIKERAKSQLRWLLENVRRFFK